MFFNAGNRPNPLVIFLLLFGHPFCQTIAFNTFLGGSAGDNIRGLATDRDGYIYLTGATASTDFPLVSPLQKTYSGGIGDAFITKLSPDGSRIIFSTYLGGGKLDIGFKIAVDSEKNVYILGGTNSTDFPVTGTAFQKTFAGGSQDCFIAKLDSSGKKLLYATYFGGSGMEGYTTSGFKMALGKDGDVYVASGTDSKNLPTKTGAFQVAYQGGTLDGYVAKFNPKDSGAGSLVYCSYLGGVGSDAYDEADAIAVDDSGQAYVAGLTQSSVFPVTKGAFQVADRGGLADAFVSKFSADGSSLVFSTRIGGYSNDEIHSIAIDSHHNPIVTGYTGSSDFPLKNPAKSTYQGFLESFVLKLDNTGSKLIFSTFFGGSGSYEAGGDIGNVVSLDRHENIFVAGYTGSTDLPLIKPVYSTSKGNEDGFAAVFSPAGKLLFSTYLGGTSKDEATSVGFSENGSLVVAGATGSADFPSEKSLQAFGGLEDGFIAKIAGASELQPPEILTYATQGQVSCMVGVPMVSLMPYVVGLVSEFSISPSLPTGLALDHATGVISGTPKEEAPAGVYKVKASNEAGSMETTIELVVGSVTGIHADGRVRSPEDFQMDFGLLRGGMAGFILGVPESGRIQLIAHSMDGRMACLVDRFFEPGWYYLPVELPVESLPLVCSLKIGNRMKVARLVLPKDRSREIR
jgi:hypothetical protein